MMIPTLRVPALLLSILLVRFSIARPQPTLVDPITCTLCDLSTLPFPCASRGIEFAVQKHPFFNYDDRWRVTVPLDMSHFYKEPAYQNGYTKRIGSSTASGGDYRIYDGAPIEAAFKAINHRAYFLAPADGRYTLTVTRPDEAVYLWVGPNAYNGKYTTDNANLAVTLQRYRGSYTFVASTKTPIALRILFLNGGGEANFEITLTDEAGGVMFGATAVADTPFFIPYTCDCSSPPFQPWGKETPQGVGTCGLLGGSGSG